MSKQPAFQVTVSPGSAVGLTAAEALAFHDLLLGWTAFRLPDLRRDAVWQGCDPHRAELLTDQLGRNLLNAEIALWNLDIWNAAVAGAGSAFADQALDTADLPSAPQLWLLGRNPAHPPASELARRQLPSGYLHRGLLLLSVVHPDQPGKRGLTVGEIWLPTATADAIPAFRFFPPMYHGDPLGGLYCHAIAALRFMHSDFASPEPLLLPRPIRRAADQGRRGPLPAINVVKLRRSARQPADAATAREARNWACQWLVSGHWRKPDPRMKEPAPVYVRPHVKGPEDKPLRTPRRTVYAVTR